MTEKLKPIAEMTITEMANAHRALMGALDNSPPWGPGDEVWENVWKIVNNLETEILARPSQTAADMAAKVLVVMTEQSGDDATEREKALLQDAEICLKGA